ncbi:MAG: hypothetical protein K2W96_27950 [Gemmataceae bacterium]|nr:hypothetical protein [Gemmataceae bacterium]
MKSRSRGWPVLRGYLIGGIMGLFLGLTLVASTGVLLSPVPGIAVPLVLLPLGLGAIIGYAVALVATSMTEVRRRIAWRVAWHVLAWYGGGAGWLGGWVVGAHLFGWSIPPDMPTLLGICFGLPTFLAFIDALGVVSLAVEDEQAAQRALDSRLLRGNAERHDASDGNGQVRPAERRIEEPPAG